MEQKLIDKVFHQHDVVCNQKYDGNPYSTHIKFVLAQGRKFQHLIYNEDCNDDLSECGIRFGWTIVEHALLLHDTIEDARLTYNNVIEFLDDYISNDDTKIIIADIVYCVTDEKGKSRGERKPEKYFSELKQNNYAIFVKLADIAANTLYSKLTNSSMYKKYKIEFKHFKEECYVEKYLEFFDYVENL